MTLHRKTSSLIIRRVWTLNFAAIVSFLIVLSWWMFQQVNLAKSDKDIILVYLVVVTGIYLVILTYLFFQKIYKWQRKGRTLYYISAADAQRQNAGIERSRAVQRIDDLTQELLEFKKQLN
jgi:hypothetical protein